MHGTILVFKDLHLIEDQESSISSAYHKLWCPDYEATGLLCGFAMCLQLLSRTTPISNLSLHREHTQSEPPCVGLVIQIGVMNAELMATSEEHRQICIRRQQRYFCRSLAALQRLSCRIGDFQGPPEELRWSLAYHQGEDEL